MTFDIDALRSLRPGAPIRIGLLLLPEFSVLPYASTLEPLRAANWLSGKELFTWKHLSHDGGPVMASSRLAIPVDGAINGDDEFDVVFVCASTGIESLDASPVHAWLRALARKGVVLAGISGGPFLLAAAGLLNGYRMTIHWDHIPGFVERFPQVTLTGRLYEIDRKRISCSGGVAPLDLMHLLISRWHGQKLADAVAEWFVRDAVRSSERLQRMTLQQRLHVTHPDLLLILSQMEERLEDPMSRDELAALISLSVRHLERLFRRHLGTTIAEHYLEIRLLRARTLLQQTAMPVVEAAMATGFNSAAHFSRVFKKRFGTSPKEARGRGQFHDRSYVTVDLSGPQKST